MQQRTLARSVTLKGTGLHSGKTVEVVFSPAEVNTGVVFLRTDIDNAQPINAKYHLVNDTQMSSNLTNALGERIGTVEHLMSAIAALGIDNLHIGVSAPEVPIMDGSALPFVEALQQAGIVEQAAPKAFIRVLRPVAVRHDDKVARFSPYDGFAMHFDIDFNHPAIHAEHSRIGFEFNSQNFIGQIARARTFGFLKDIEYLKSHNLALGGSMDNAIVLDDCKVINPEGLRFDDEFVRHKVLDAVGDLYLAGHQILGEFYAYKSGHALNNQLLKALMGDPKNYEIVTEYENVNEKIYYIS